MTVCPGLVDIHAHMAGISDPVYATPAESSLFPFGITAAIEASARAKLLIAVSESPNSPLC